MRVHSILENIDPSEVDERLGFPLVVRPDVLPPDYYAELERSFPALSHVIDGRKIKNNRAYRISAMDALRSRQITAPWRAFVDYHTSPAFFDEFRALFGPAIERTHPRLAANFGKPLRDFTADRRVAISKGNTFKAHSPFKRIKPRADAMLDSQISFNSPVHEPCTVRGAHLDHPSKLYTALLYFRQAGDDAGGHLNFYRRKPSTRERPDRCYREESLELVRQIRYEANTLVIFANSPRSIHGVTPRAVTPRPRRYVNIIGECYGGATPDFLTTSEPDGPYWPRAIRGALMGLVR